MCRLSTLKNSYFATFAAFSLLSFGARAQDIPATCPEKPLDEESAVALAGIWFDRGIGLVDAGQDKEALAAFNCSMRMVEHPDTVFNAAQAARLAGESELSLRLFQRYIRIAPYGSMSDKAEYIIREIKEKQPEDDQDAPSVNLSSPPRYPLELAPFPEKEPPPKSIQNAAIATLSVGGAALVSATVCQILAYKAVQDGERTDNYHDSWRSYEKRMEQLQNAAIATFVVGGLAAGTGFTLLIIDKKKKNPLGERSVSVLPSYRGFVISGRF